MSFTIHCRAPNPRDVSQRVRVRVVLCVVCGAVLCDTFAYEDTRGHFLMRVR